MALIKLIVYILDEPWLAFSLSYIVVLFVMTYGPEYSLVKVSGLLLILFILVICRVFGLPLLPVILLLLTAGALAGLRYNNNEREFIRSVESFNLIADSKREGINLLIVADPQLNHSYIDYPVEVSEVTSISAENGERVKPKTESEDIESAIEKGNKAKLLLRTAKFPKYTIGDSCALAGEDLKLKKISEPYQSYLKTKDIVGIVEVRNIKCHQSEKATTYVKLRRSLFEFKTTVSSRIIANFLEPKASLLAGMIFGDDRLFSEEFDQSLRNTGTTHIIAASGFNINIIVSTIDRVLKTIVRFKVRGFLIVITIWMFALCANLSGSILRATTMYTVLFAIRLLGFRSTPMKGLIIAAFFLLLAEPDLARNIGFLLSTGATLGLIIFLPFLEMLYERAGSLFRKNRSPSKNDLVNSLLLPSTACTVGTLPLSRMFFQTGNLLTVLPNLFLLPIVEYIYFMGVLIVLLTFVVPQSITNLFISAENILLSIFISVIRWFDPYLSLLGQNEKTSMISVILTIAIIIPSTIYTLKKSEINRYQLATIK